MPWCLVVPRSSEIVRAKGEVTRLGRGKGGCCWRDARRGLERDTPAGGKGREREWRARARAGWAAGVAGDAVKAIRRGGRCRGGRLPAAGTVRCSPPASARMTSGVICAAAGQRRVRASADRTLRKARAGRPRRAATAPRPCGLERASRPSQATDSAATAVTRRRRMQSDQPERRRPYATRSSRAVSPPASVAPRHPGLHRCSDGSQ